VVTKKVARKLEKASKILKRRGCITVSELAELLKINRGQAGYLARLLSSYGGAVKPVAGVLCHPTCADCVYREVAEAVCQQISSSRGRVVMLALADLSEKVFYDKTPALSKALYRLLKSLLDGSIVEERKKRLSLVVDINLAREKLGCNNIATLQPTN
jgi:hypothetical protein